MGITESSGDITEGLLRGHGNQGSQSEGESEEAEDDEAPDVDGTSRHELTSSRFLNKPQSLCVGRLPALPRSPQWSRY